MVGGDRQDVTSLAHLLVERGDDAADLFVDRGKAVGNLRRIRPVFVADEVERLEVDEQQIGDFELERPFLSSYRLRMFVHLNKHLPLADPVLNRKVKIVWATYFGIGAGAGMMGLGGLSAALY